MRRRESLAPVGSAATWPVSVRTQQTGAIKSGALISYDPDPRDAARRATSYVDRILRGESPAELPVQAPVKFQTAVNVRNATALGLTIPAGILVAADEVVE